jgi:hypothetical protein
VPGLRAGARRGDGLRRAGVLALAALLGCAKSDGIDLLPIAETLAVEPQSISSGGPGTEAVIVVRLVGWNGQNPSPVRWASSNPGILVDSLVPLGQGARVRFTCRCTGTLTGTLERPGPHVVTVPVTITVR